MRMTFSLLSIALVATPLLSECPMAVKDYHFGAQVGLSLPLGDAKTFVDSSPGFTLGAHLILNTKGGHVLRPRLDYTSHSGTIRGVSNKNYTYNAGVDYLYFLPQAGVKNVYFFGGLGWATTNLDGRVNDHTSALSLNAGGGFQFTTALGAELRYTTTRPSLVIVGDYTNNSLSAVATYRF